ncbi:hypothetical protein MCEMSEM18_03497 [Comamonadaceae bacterium]
MTTTTDMDLSQFKVIQARVPQRPEIDKNPLRALIHMLESESLHPDCDMRDPTDDTQEQIPFRGRCWGACVSVPIEGTHRRRYVDTKPIHPAHPEAVRYCGNFFETSFAFELDTDDTALIALLDALIAANMATPAYGKALEQIGRRKR